MKWLYRYMDMANFIASEWSKDPCRKVGAIITLDNYPIGLGVNGFPRGVSDSTYRLYDKDVKNALTVHAEINALIRADYKGDTCIVTYFPCLNCLKQLVLTGIKRIVVPDVPIKDKYNPKLTLEVAKELGVSFTFLKLKPKGE